VAMSQDSRASERGADAPAGVPPVGADKRTVLVVDDEPEVSQGIALALRRAPFAIMAAHSAASAFEVLRAHLIDVVVSDECMPGMTGTVFLARVHMEFPAVARILLTGHATLDVATRAINEGKISFFLQKPCSPERLLEAISGALASQPSRDARDKEDSIAQGFPRKDFGRLSNREKEILCLIVDGQRLGQIAKALFISEHTARNHLKVIFRKLDVHSQSELMRLGRQGNAR